MGSFASKTWSEVNDYYYKNSVPMNGSTDKRCEPLWSRVSDESTDGRLDPRSPTQDFDRTPIQVIEYKQRHDISVDEISGEALAIMGSSDPRSPTLGIDRTPLDLAANESPIDVQMSAMRLSFGSNVTDLSITSLDSPLVGEDKRDSKTPSVGDKETASGERVRTPLSSVPQKLTPNRNAIRNRKQLEITKRAHINSHLMKTKSMASNDTINTLSPQLAVEDKENL